MTPSSSTSPLANRSEARTSRRGLRALAAGLVVLLLLVVAGLTLGLRTDAGQRWATAAVAAALGQAIGGEVTIGGIGLVLPATLIVRDVRVAKDGEVWLSTGGARIVGSPAALLQRRLLIDDIRIEALRIERLPSAQVETRPASGRFALPRPPRLPLAVEVRRLAVHDLHLGAAILGEPISITADGTVTLAADRVELGLGAVRTDGRAGRLSLDSRWQRGTDDLSVALDIEDPPDGLLAATLGETSYRGLSVNLAGEAPLDDWRGVLTVALPQMGQAKADLRLRATDDRLGFAVAGTGGLEAPLPGLAPEAAAHAVLRLAGEVSGEDRLTIEDLDLALAEARLSGSGAIDLRSGTLDAHFAAALSERALAVDPSRPVRFQTLAVDGRVSGSTVSPTMVISASATGLETGIPTLQSIIGGSPTLALKADLRTNDGLLVVEDAILGLIGGSLTANGSYALDSTRIQADMFAAIKDIASAAAGGVSGPATVQMTVDANLAQQTAHAQLSATVDPFASRDEALAVALGPRPRGSAIIRYDPKQGLTVEQLAIEGARVRSDGSGSLDVNAKLDVRAQIEAPDLKPLAAALATDAAGSARLDLHLTGPLADPDLKATLVAQPLAVDGTSLPSAHVSLQISRTLSEPNGAVSIIAETEAGSATLRSQVALDRQRRLMFSAIKGDWAGVRLAGDLEIPLRGKPVVVEGLLIGSLTAEDPGIAIAGNRLTGNARFQAALSRTNGGQGLDLQLDGGPIALVERGGSAVGIGGMRVAVRTAPSSLGPRLNLEAQARAATLAGFAIARIDLSADATANAGRIGLTVAEPAGTKGQVALKAQFARENGRQALTIDDLQGQLAGQRLKLREPLTVEAAGGRLSVRSLHLAVGRGAIQGNGVYGTVGHEVRASLRAKSLPLELAQAFAPQLAVKGEATVDAHLHTEAGRLAGGLHLKLTGVQPSGAAELARTNVAVNADWTEGVISAEAKAFGPGDTALAANARVSLAVDARTLRLPPAEAMPLAARLEGTARLEALAPLLELPDQAVAGAVAIKASVSGTVGHPQPILTATVKQGRYENFASGTLLTDIALAADTDRTRTITVSFSARDGGTGTLSGSGQVRVLPDQPTSVELALKIDDARLIRRDDATATLAAEIGYTGDGASGRITGWVQSSSVEIRLLDRLPPSVVTLPVTEINRPGAAASTAPQAKPDPWAVDLDLSVRIPGRAFVRGRGLDSEWSGDLQVGGTTAAPRLRGDVSLRRGRFDFAGKRFALTKGVIRLLGEAKIDPLVELSAEFRSRQLTAVISVSGLASQPQIVLTSRPELPQGEIMSQVLFGRSSTQLGPIQAVQLAAALDTLARGESLTEDALSFARTLLGVDTLDVDAGSEENGGASVTVGRHLGNGVYVSGTRGATDNTQRGKVEVEIAPGLTAETSVGQTGDQASGSVGLRWSWDY